MGFQLVIVDAFTNKTFGGNPAGVCVLDRDVDTDWMRSLAKELDLPATAFVRHHIDHFDLRWFTAVRELEFCGHGTLASAFALWQRGLAQSGTAIRFESKRGALGASDQGGGWIELDLPADPAPSAQTAPAALLDALHVTPRFVGKGSLDYLIELDSQEQVEALSPDFQLLKTVQARGVIVTSRAASKEYDFVSRFFAPSVGIDEDPVTGSAHCLLGPYWQKELDKSVLAAYQASERGGVLRLRLAGDRVKLSGQAVMVMKGELC